MSSDSIQDKLNALSYLKGCGGSCPMSQFDAAFPDRRIRAELFMAGRVRVDNQSCTITLVESDLSHSARGPISFRTFLSATNIPPDLMASVPEDLHEMMDRLGSLNYLKGRTDVSLSVLDVLFTEDKQ